MPRLLRTACFALAATALLAACGQQAQDTHPQQLVSQRQAVFKQFTSTLEPMGLMARERKPYEAAAFKASALELQRLSTLPWVFFTPDGNYPPTRAKPAVWSEPEAFKQAQQGFATAVGQLVQVTQAGDKSAIGAAVNEVQSACKSCHDRFRNEGRGS